MRGQLFLVPTPIGNLEDMTLRGIRVLKEADVILCEDTRHSKKLLKHYEIEGKLISYHEHNEQKRSETLLRMLEEGCRAALISDAGMPCISDPGAVAVKAVLDAGFPVVVLPGASAVLTALVLSGFGGGSFYFHGFLTRKGKKRREELEKIKQIEDPVILYESPYRLKSTLQELEEQMPGREAAVLRELTKLYEERIAGSIPEILTQLPETVKGEIVLVLGPWKAAEEKKDPRELLLRLTKEGMSTRDAIARVSQITGLSKNEVYAISIEMKRS